MECRRKAGRRLFTFMAAGWATYARTDLRRRATEKHPETPVKILCNWLTFGKESPTFPREKSSFSPPNICDDLCFYSSTIYTALIFVWSFNHPYLSILFATYSIFGLYFRIFLFYFHFHLVTDFGLCCYQSSFR